MIGNRAKGVNYIDFRGPRPGIRGKHTLSASVAFLIELRAVLQHGIHFSINRQFDLV
jgi:hypothetical protein